ncbi:MAG: Copper resistance protein CopC [Ilumatobacteraceae bacterium]|nr:Copper resistance protein CopC [Ilumatobacteraceae bacterium]
MHPLPSVRLRRALGVALFILVAAFIPASTASAHAELVATDPADGSVVEKAPAALTLQFSEDVSLQPDGVRVLDGKGRRVDAGSASSEGSDVTAPLEGTIADGTYAVAWRAVSADGHPIRGSYTFSVGRASALGDGVAAGAFGSGNDRAYEIADALARTIAYLAVLGATGYILIASALRRSEDPSPVGRRTTIAACIGLAAIIIQVPLQGALATGRGLTAITDSSVLGLAVADGMGWAALLASIGLLAVIITSGLPWEGAARRVGLVGAVIAPLGFVLTGHTLTMSPAVVGYLADLAHVMAAAVWFGGLIAVVVAVRRRRREDEPLGAAEAIATFSGWAAVTAAVLIVAGLVLSWIEVGSLDALTTTLYGRLLLVKFALVVLVLGAAAWNRFRLVPRVAAAAIEDPPVDDAASWTMLLRLVRAEIALLVVVLMVTAVLSNASPAKVSVDQGPITVSAELGSGSMDVTVDPAQAGRNDVHIYLFDADGRPADQYDEAEVSLELPSQGLGPFDREPVRAANGHFQLVATDLPLAGTWSMTVTVKPDRFTETKATVTFPVS